MIEEIYHFLRLNDLLFTSGMPTADQLADASKQGIQLVVNLAMPDSERALRDEKSIVESLGMKYIPIPVQWDNPTRADLEEFMQVMDAHHADKVLVHCQANYRVTGFMALYRVLRLGWEPEEAFKDLRRIWDPEQYPVWKKFLDENLKGGRPDRTAQPD
jgi:protein tyrosine phosphatase (PTP) superfamily phosphohydrolase (DUF442 family)